MLTDQIEPPFSTKVKGDICEEVLNRTRHAIDRASDRDNMFLTWSMQAEGDPNWCGMKVRWKGGCDIEDPMTDEHKFEVVAALSYISRQQEWFSGHETQDTPDAAKVATGVEALLNDIVVEAHLNSKHHLDLLDNGFTYSYGVLCIDWKQEFKRKYTPKFRHRDKGTLHDETDPEIFQNPDDYDLMEEGEEDLEYAGIDCRVPYTGDVYLDSPSAQSFQTASRIIERFEYTEDDLVNGIYDAGFDRKIVEDMLRSGPTRLEDRTYRSDRDIAEGVSGDGETWEVFRVIGTPPSAINHERLKIKEEDRRRDYQWMICPGHQAIFKFAPSPYWKRPYAKFPFRGRAGRMIGHSGCSMLSPLQQELTHAFRFRIDFRDLFMSSPLFAPLSIYEQLIRFTQQPGRIIPVPDRTPPGVVAPVPYNPAGYQAAMQDYSSILQRGEQLFSADVRGPAAFNRATATQVAQASSGADEKLDLLNAYFMLGKQEAGDIILSHYRQFAPEVIERKVGTQIVNLSQSDLASKSFRVVPVGSSESTNPRIKLERAQLLAQFAMQDPILKAQIERGDLTGAEEVMRRLYSAVGVKNPQAIHGPSQQPPPNDALILQAVFLVAQQFAKAGDPGATHILQQMQQMMASRQQGQPEQGRGQGGGGGRQEQGGRQGTSMSVKYGELDPQQKAQAAQKMGLPPPSNNGNGMIPMGGVR